MSLRERFEKLDRYGRGEFDSDIKVRPDGWLLDREAVLALVEEVERELAKRDDAMIASMVNVNAAWGEYVRWLRGGDGPALARVKGE